MLASIARIHWRHGCPTCSVAPRGQCPEAAPRRAKGAGLDGEGADRAILYPPLDGRLHILSAVSAIPSGRDPSLKSSVIVIRFFIAAIHHAAGMQAADIHITVRSFP